MTALAAVEPVVRDSRWPLGPGWRLWTVVGILAAIDALCIALPQFTIDWLQLAPLAAVVIPCFLWCLAGWFVPLSPGPRLLAAGLCFIIVSARVLGTLSQAAMTLQMPMADDLLAIWDEAIGLDWPAYLSFVAGRPWLAQSMTWLYPALIPTSLAAFLFLHFTRRWDRVSELLTLYFISGVIVVLIGAAFPTQGAVIHHNATELMTAAGFKPGTGAIWIDRLAELRSGATIDLTKLHGLVSFPSYHVALAIIIAWCCRGILFVSPILIAFAVGTAACTPIIGGHYFVDLIGGAALAAGLIWITRPTSSRLARRSQPRYSPSSQRSASATDR